MPKLKVFCTTSGFHDSIVAAPSKAAALKAWGAKTDLFSMGAARLVTDPKVARKALDRPGEVIRLRRGGDGGEVATPSKAKRKPDKRPSRAKLKAAEDRLARLETEQSAELERLERELRRLEKKRDATAARHRKARSAAEEKAAQARDEYEEALAVWSE